ncbi:Lsr2 family protein [Mycobacterium colombiense]|uniref:Lsr2 family protein n=1 Tax=Mycobacterium colombiense TaxID=339268 RepID=A0A329MCG6_9MYCO|nr:Lsr2 family protein [Mycobacterium colombiense]RAV17530.1 Lsr2 family protein [Mycobacterium colombiense]
MSRKTIHLLFDDMAEGEEIEADAGTVIFGYQGRQYEIDLCKKNATKLDGQLKPWIEHARLIDSGNRRVTRKPRSPSVQTPMSSGYSSEQLAEIRSWARRNGHEVSDRGRIPLAILQAFEEGAGR